RRTRRIVETIHVDFDELTEMTHATISSGLVPKPTSSTPYVPPSRNDWDLLFQPMFDELLTPPPSVDPPAPEVIAPIADVIPPEQAKSTDVEEDIHDIEVAHMGNDLLFGMPIPEVASDQSSSTVLSHTIVHPDHQISQHNSKWTKDHPLENIIGQLSRPVSTRLQLHEQALFCYYDAFLTSVDPKTNDWDLLFQLLFDELLNPPPSVDNQDAKVIAPIAEVIPQVDDDSIGSHSSTAVDQDAPSPSKSLTPIEIQSLVIPQDVRNDNLDIEVAHMGNDPLLGVPITEVASGQSSSTASPQANVQPNHPMTYPNSKWTKDHPLNYIIGPLSRPVSTRLQLHEQALFCYYDDFLTSVEPKTYKEALTQACWIEAMQEELH
nr:hypothetical protein [Tanacetum cinerariifolium]